MTRAKTSRRITRGFSLAFFCSREAFPPLPRSTAPGAWRRLSPSTGTTPTRT